MLDTDVLISMIIFPNKRFLQMLEFITQKHTLVLSSIVIDELIAVADRKFPAKKYIIESFLEKLSYEFIYTPHIIPKGLFEIRDINDYPVLYAAIIENIEIFITGNKDFSNVNIEKPEIIIFVDFIMKYTS